MNFYTYLTSHALVTGKTATSYVRAHECSDPTKYESCQGTAQNHYLEFRQYLKDNSLEEDTDNDMVSDNNVGLGRLIIPIGNNRVKIVETSEDGKPKLKTTNRKMCEGIRLILSIETTHANRIKMIRILLEEK